MIGIGRHRVQRRLEAMRAADAAVAPDERQYRTITQAQFRRLCGKEGGISSPDLLLSYLHNAGIVFYRPELFHDAIILDQNWALEAIYAVFHRGRFPPRQVLYEDPPAAWPLHPLRPGRLGVEGAQRRRAGVVPQHDAILWHLLRISAHRPR